MITQTDSGLTAEQYAIVEAGGRPYAFSITAHQHNPSFTQVAATSAAPTNDTDEFTVLKAGTFIFRLTVDVLERMNASVTTPVWTKMTGYVPPPSPLGVSVAMTYNASTVTITIYACTLTGVKVCTSVNNGATWSAWAVFALGTTGTQSQYSYSGDIATDVTKAVASSVLEGIYIAARGFDNAATMWCSAAVPAAGASSQWLRYDFTTAKAITKYTMWGRPAAQFDQNPRNWTLESSPDAVTWTIRDTRTSITNWSPNETKTFIIKPLTDVSVWAAARYWRFNCTLNNGSSVGVGIQELDMMETVFTSVPEIVRISAPSPTRLHFIVKDANRGLYNLRVASLVEDVWQFTTSDIFWTFDILGFKAISATDDVDVIALSTDIPGTLSILNENNAPAKYIFTSGGLLAMTYRYGVWSDHIDVEVVDDVQSYRYRRAARIAKLNGRLYMTGYSSDGTEDFPVQGYRVYSANTDAQFWSNGNVLPLPDGVGSSGVALVDVDNYIYAIEAKNTYRAFTTYYFGRSAAAMQVSLTEYVAGTEFTQENMFQSGILLANPLNAGSNTVGVWDNNNILKRTNTVWLTHRMGYWANVNGIPTRILVQVALTQVESFSYAKAANGERTLRLSCRDILSRATDYVKSEQARYWKSQQLGADNYTDNAGSNYGGLSHTATDSGAHQTRNRYLEVNTDNAEAVAFSTFLSNIWNGTQQVKFYLKNGSTLQYAGVVFRALDGDNLWYAYYQQSTDKIILGRRVNGVEFTLQDNFQSAALSWSSNLLIGRYIRVEFRYGLIKVFTSSDSAVATLDGGRVWTKRIEHKVNCLERVSGGAYLKRLEEAMAERGFVGLIGKGPL